MAFFALLKGTVRIHIKLAVHPFRLWRNRLIALGNDVRRPLDPHNAAMNLVALGIVLKDDVDFTEHLPHPLGRELSKLPRGIL